MKSITEDPAKKRKEENIDVTKTNKTDEYGAYIDKDGRSRNYKGGKKSGNGPNFDIESEASDGDTTAGAGVFK